MRDVSACVHQLLVLSTTIPQANPVEHCGGLPHDARHSILSCDARLRGLLSLDLAGAAGGAMVIVNKVVYVQGMLGRPEADVAITLAVFGGGSMLSALLLPRILDRLPNRSVMSSQGEAVTWPALLAVWFVVGLGYSAVLTPSARRAPMR